MQQKNKIISWWMTPKFPLVHLEDKTSFVKKWIFHPIKRRLAKNYLGLLQKFTDIKVIGITGSAGKTTTKEMLASILKKSGKTVWTPRNIDPIYNIPTTILRTPIGTKYLILEMGVEYPDEMNFYLWLAKLDVGVITNIFPTHLEFMKSIEGVFDEKKKIVTRLTMTDVAILNEDDAKLKSLKNKLKSQILWFKSNTDPIKQNAEAAKLTAESLGISPAIVNEGLDSYTPPEHRLNWIKSKNGLVILDDTYNSNPQAVLTTLSVFENKYNKEKRYVNQKIAILGDMLELGNYEEKAHKEIGKKVSEMKFDIVIGVGKASRYLIKEINNRTKNVKTFLVSNNAEALEIVKPLIVKNTWVLVKGSHSIHLEEVVKKLT